MLSSFKGKRIKNTFLKLKKKIEKQITPRDKKQSIATMEGSYELKPILPNHEDKYELSHIAAYVTKSNAGDILLPVVLRDLFVDQGGGINWQSFHAYESVTSELINRINDSQGLIIGGGGLFLRDTNKNNISGWQWACPIEKMESIEVPICIFAVGYNRFRGQEEFDQSFSENLKILTEKAVYIGLRNSGSIEAIRSYLPNELQEKVIFQPCMTTFTSILYPHLFRESNTPKTPFLALNCAFDRSGLRFGHKKEEILQEIANGVFELAKKTGLAVKYYSHFDKDLEMAEFLRSKNFEFEVCDLSKFSPPEIVAEYRTPSLVFGMRGHAQMIPFGCQTPIISLVSHNKLQWFLDDIKKPDWSVDLSKDNVANKIIDRGSEILADRESIIKAIKNEQMRLWNISVENVSRFLGAVDAHKK